MEFSSLTFILLFLPVFVVLETISFNRTLRNILLLVFSIIFLILSDIKYLPLILLIVLFSYLFGLIINKSKVLYALYLLIIVGLLSFFKYGNYFLDSFLSFTGIESIISPLGISFLTFTSISYVSDVFYGKIEKEKNPINVLNYLLFFPTFISGPILRYKGYKESLKERNVNLITISRGFKRFSYGLFKKIVIADHLAIVVDKVFGIETISASLAWYGLLAYAIQLLMDFDGYSDMAIGVAEMVGFNMPENFDSPYLSTSISMFWRKWHMTLGSWFKDYVYIPLGGNRVNKIRWIFNVLVVWLLTGVWHGATINYLFWGLYFGILIVIERLIRKKEKESFIFLIPTQILVLFGWLIFRSPTIDSFMKIFNSLFNYTYLYDYKLSSSLNVLYLLPYLLAGIVLIPFSYKKVEKLFSNIPIIHILIAIVMLGISIFFIVVSSYSSFIYFGF